MADYVIFSEYGPVQLCADMGESAAGLDPLDAAVRIMESGRLPHVRIGIVTLGGHGCVALERLCE